VRRPAARCATRSAIPSTPSSATSITWRSRWTSNPTAPATARTAASQRLLQRAVGQLGRRFADYVVADGADATAPVLPAAGALGLRIVARLKGNRPELAQAVQARFGPRAPTATFPVGRDRVELWDADDFDPWAALRWPPVRVVRYRQHKPDGTVVEADWLTDWPTRQVGALSLYGIATSRWEMENQGFTDATTRAGLAHLRHHHANRVRVRGLLLALAMPIERLYRQRYLHRGPRPVYTPIALVRLLWLSLRAPHARHDPG
jgi:hypothetical protein